MEHKTLALNCAGLKFDDAGRKFSGYASVFNGLDSYGDTVMPGAYADTIKDRKQPIALRWNHYGPVIGKWVHMAEDEKGLYVEGELTPGHSVAEDVYALLKHGSVTGMSIGYRIPAGGASKDGDKRLLKRIDLIEISIVESPADQGAQIGDVKSAIEQVDSLKDAEELLRNNGFTRSDACALVSRIKSLGRGDHGPQNQTAAIAGLFQHYNDPQP